MPKVNITELRQNLPAYLAEAQKGREIEVTSRGKVIARIVPESESHEQARARLLAARKHCRIDDVLSPTGAAWDAERDRS
ncbi:MAG: type II toxin-antitoxin system prevent-host-death family antitoxin [Burkholderiales bacterium]|nr:type II toxin-antitoxin system prevent-host-death family antitoxin [Burkholderiales bacterium]